MKWHAIGASALGASHERAGTLNQDAIGWWPVDGEGPPLVLVISDGHGSPDCFRSDIGSRLATEAASNVIRTFLEKNGEHGDSTLVKRLAEQHLPQRIVGEWKEKVGQHLLRYPLRAADADSPGDYRGRLDNSALTKAVLEPLLVYGATLLAVAVTKDLVLYLQLGDGDILAVSTDGSVTRPIAGDDRLVGNETTSLCQRDAWKEFRIGFGRSPESTPALILVATDGYANSFREERDFRKAGSDILDSIRKEGVRWIDERLLGWLEDASRKGSGDDITVGLLVSSLMQAPSSRENSGGVGRKNELRDAPELATRPGLAGRTRTHPSREWKSFASASRLPRSIGEPKALGERQSCGLGGFAWGDVSESHGEGI